MIADLAVVVVAWAIFGAFVWYLGRPWNPPPEPVISLIEERLCHAFVVTLKTGASFRGLLYAVDDRVVVLRDTHALGAGPKGEHVAVDGELLLFRSEIEYLQRP